MIKENNSLELKTVVHAGCWEGHGLFLEGWGGLACEYLFKDPHPQGPPLAEHHGTCKNLSHTVSVSISSAISCLTSGRENLPKLFR